MKTIILLVTLAFGILFPQGHVLSFLLKYFLMGLLLFAFLDIRIDKNVIKKSHFFILTANLIVPLVLYFLLNLFNHQLAQTAFITALAPIVIALLVPFLLTNFAGNSSSINIWSIFYPVLIVFSIPLLLGQTLKYFLPVVHSFLSRFKDDPFYLLMGAIYLGTSNASNYLRTEMHQSFDIVFYIGITSFLICFLNFNFGRFLGGKDYSIEGGQSLGQKNNAFTIWIALTFISPLAVVRPVFYVLFQNLFISWELYQHNKMKS